ncbi:hypothetical protein N482_22010 [Pseudoalteromonas luteoviolacea NCIMB 1942]|uniref:Rhodanese domain-containing protein n=1 Tax=Pseudoalteromonas luteoviolacea NCIMB 1942 TaxID=1365253 RepID=A0A167HSW4_9GAMM|nr:hypothetical protein N482_22010 [Pseudoalteromonas luteoviolacea NCIMB 1942]
MMSNKALLVDVREPIEHLQQAPNAAMHVLIGS